MAIKDILKKTKLLKSEEETKEEEQPKKPIAFEEFDVEKEVIEELDNLEVEQEEEKTDENSDKEDLVEVLPEEYKNEKGPNLVDVNSDEYSKIIRENISFCTSQIKEISSSMADINDQKSSESFWKKSENIKTISKYVSKMSDVQQKTLDLLVLLLGASGKMVEDYDTVMKTIDELSDLNGGEAEVLNYLLKVKKMVKEIKDNDQRLKDVIYSNEEMQRKVDEFENLLEENKKNTLEKVDDVSKDVNRFNSKMKRIEGKINRNSFFIFLSFVGIAVLVILFYLKMY